VPLIYGLLLAAMAAGQLSDPAGFADILATYDVFGGAESWAAGIIIAAEVVAATGLLGCRVAPRGGRIAGGVGIAVAVFWATMAVQAFARGLEVPNCGCFGVHLGQRLRWWVLLEDVYMLVLAWYAARGAGLRLPALFPVRRRASAPV
jgi:hypothetical protein